MKILILSDAFPPAKGGGAASVAYTLAKGYARAGHTIHVLTTHQDSSRPPRDTTILDSITIESVYIMHPHPLLRFYASLWNTKADTILKRTLKEFSPDAVHAHNVHHSLTWNSLRISRMYTENVIVTLHDVMSFCFAKLTSDKYIEPKNIDVRMQFDERMTMFDHWKAVGILYNPFRKFFIQRALKHASHIVATSHALEVAARKNGINVTDVIYSGIDLFLPLPTAQEIAEWKKQWNLEGRKIIFFGGRLSREKGIFAVLHALKRIKNDIPEVTLFVAGDTNRFLNIGKTLPFFNELSPYIQTTGWLEEKEINLSLASCDVCITPSVCFDTFPTVNLEAMSMSKPVIATHFGGSREAVEDKKTGYIINPFNIEDMTKKLITLLTDTAKSMTMGKAGRRRIEENFTIEKQVRLYEELINKKNYDNI